MSIPRPNGSGATDRVIVPCGKCPECLANKRSQWSFRLSQELKYTEFNSFFITLTYDDLHLPFAIPEIGSNMVGSPTLVKSDLQLFFKRLRKKLATNIRYYAVGEYGSRTSRPHYHAIVFNIDLDMVNELLDKGCIPSGAFRNLKFVEKSVHFGAEVHYNKKIVACDAQTSGGLLFAIKPQFVNEAIEMLKISGVSGVVVGEVIPKSGKEIYMV